MKNRTLLYLSIFSAIIMGILLLINFFNTLHIPVLNRYLSPNDVKGSAVIHAGKPYTLNFDQQNSMITLVNQAVPVNKTAFPIAATQIDFDKIVIYRFNGPDIDITPITFFDEELIFSSPEWNPTGYLHDTSNGKLKALIYQTFEK